MKTRSQDPGNGISEPSTRSGCQGQGRFDQAGERDDEPILSSQDVTVAQVLTSVRRAVSNHQNCFPWSQAPPGPLSNDAQGQNETSPRWEHVSASLQLAERYADAGRKVPDLPQFRGFTRRLALLVAKGVQYLARVVTTPQRKYNSGVLNALREIQNAVCQLEQISQANLRLLTSLQARFDELENRLGPLPREPRDVQLPGLRPS